MSNITKEQTFIEFNKEVDEFIEQNSDRIICTITSAVSYTYQPIIVTYQKYFNDNVNNIYDSKSIYAHNHDLPDFIYTYFILKRTNKTYDPKELKEHCDIYVKNFIEFNEKVFTAISASIHEADNFDIIETLTHGDLQSLKDVNYLNNS